MKEQNLKNWLQACDATANGPVMPRLSADHLERLVSDRRSRLRGFTVAGTAVVAAVAVFTALSLRTGPGMTSVHGTTGAAAAGGEAKTNSVIALHEQLKSLKREIDERRALVAALRNSEEVERLNRELEALEAVIPNSLSLSSMQAILARNEAAAVSLRYADALVDEFDEKDLAAAEYRAIVNRYPATSWSAAAERSLQSTSQSL